MNNSILLSLFFFYLLSGCAIINKSSLHPLYPMYPDWTGGADVVRCECMKEELLGVWECNYSDGEALLLKFDKNNEVTICKREYQEKSPTSKHHIPVSHEFKRDFYLVDCNTIYFANIEYTRLGTMAKLEIVGDKITLETNRYSSMTQIQLKRVPTKRFDEMINEEQRTSKRWRNLYAPQNIKKEAK